MPGHHASDEFDVIIAGAGPSGSSCAAALGDKGYRVLLLDKATFPRDKTCGDGISGKSTHALAKLGLLEKVAKAPNAVMHAVTFSSPDGTVVRIDSPLIHGNKKPTGYVVKREIFDKILFDNAKGKKTVTALEGTEVVDIIKGPDGKAVNGVSAKSADGTVREYRAKVVVGADGANSVVARKLGIPSNEDKHWCVGVRQYWSGVTGLDDSIELHFVDSAIPGYFWIFPSADGQANVGLGILLSDKKRKKFDNLQKLMTDIIHNNKMFSERFANAKPVSEFRGWNLPYASQKRKSYGNGWLLVGDAASLIDPFTGEGIGNALTSGMIAADSIDEAFTDNDFSEKSLKRYWDALWKEIEVEINSSYELQKRAKGRRLLNWVIKKAATNHEVRDAIAGTFHNIEARKTYRSPLFYLRLLLP